MKSPKWIHFGGGNLFRAFHAAIADELLQNGASDTGVIVAETYDDAVIDDIYNKYDNRILRVVTKADGSQDRELFASVAKAIYAGPVSVNPKGFESLTDLFKQDSLQVVSFSFPWLSSRGYF